MSNEEQITKEYLEAMSHYREFLAHSFLCGRLMVNVREQVGPQVFTAWLAKNCPQVPPEDAAEFMNRSLNSPLAQQVDNILPPEE